MARRTSGRQAIGCRASATSTRTRAVAPRGGTARRGIARSRRTSYAELERVRVDAAADRGVRRLCCLGQSRLRQIPDGRSMALSVDARLDADTFVMALAA